MSAELPFLAARRIGLCGSRPSKAKEEEFSTFCREVGATLAGAEGTVISTAGRLSANGVAAADVEFVEGFKARANAKDVMTRIETFRGMNESKSDEFFQDGKIIKISGGSAEARRFKMVAAVDGLIGVGGVGNGTEQQLTLAFATEKPALPIPSFGGRSSVLWHDHRDQLIERLGLSKEKARAWERQPDSSSAAKKLAAAMVRTFLDSLEHRCFVIMPFDSDFSALIDFVINPVVRALGDDPRHLGRMEKPGDVGRQISEEVSKADYVVCVLDGMRPNVLYELGMAHALRKPAVLIWKKHPWRLIDVPFDIVKEQRIEYEAIDDRLGPRLGKAIRHIKRQLAAESE